MLFEKDAEDVDIQLDAVDRQRIAQLTLAMGVAAARAGTDNPMDIEETTLWATLALFGPFRAGTENLGAPVAIVRRIEGWEIIVDPHRVRIRRQR